jgi:hypothetical protein
MPASNKDVLALLGDPKEVDRELASFRRTARVLSSDHPRLIDEYSQQWIVAFEGKVRASGNTLTSVLKQADAEGLPRDKIIVRHIDKNQRTMIL